MNLRSLFQKTKQKIEAKKIKTDKILIIAFGALGAAILLICLLPEASTETAVAATNSAEVDTLIPAGFMLIPVELINAEAMSGLAGQYGVIDLFTANPEKGKKAQKILSKAKILRAPLNPNQFAVLVKEADGTRLLSHAGPYFAALKNPKDTVPTAEGPRHPLTISYGD